jgi:NAD(P)-dependent dehydrogenase (short-subunit alcohol dehydrogenase family)
MAPVSPNNWSASACSIPHHSNQRLRPDGNEVNATDREQHNRDLAAGPRGRPAHSEAVGKGRVRREHARSRTRPEVATVAGDITQQADIDRIVSTAGSRIDGLANVAGVNDDFSPAHETSDAIWDRVLAINLTGSFKLTRAVLPTMLAAGRGAIVNVSSEAGLRGNASGTAYTVSKHGIVGLTRSAAFMYGPQGIRVNAVAPGGVATGIPMPATISEYGRGRLGPFLNLIPTVATAEHLAASITFLLSDDAVNIDGAILPSDGGWSVQ